MKSENIPPGSKPESIAPVPEGAEDRILLHEIKDEQTATVPDAATRQGSKRRLLRWTLLTLGPLLLLGIGAYVYITGGRYAETDNAYIKADKVSLSAQVSGPITEVLVGENQHVTSGQVLFRIDQAPFKLALTKAQDHQAGIRTLLTSVVASYRQKQAELDRDITDEKFNEREFKRQSELASKNLASQSTLDGARHNMEMATRQVAITRQALSQLAAQLGGNPDAPLEQHPLYRETQAAVDDAELSLSHTEARAPFDGIVRNKPEPGQYVRAGEPVMALIADKGMWIEANFKETELTHVQPGQQVDISVDTYPGHHWHGHVASLSQASGAEFSLLPPQNATGNWVKVVQRIPVRIEIDNEPGSPDLRAGMSTVVSIDTHHHRVLPGFIGKALAWFGAGAAESAAAYSGRD